MSNFRKGSVWMIALVVVLAFALPAFAEFITQKGPVTFKQNTALSGRNIVMDSNYAYVAAYDGGRLVLYQYYLSTGNLAGVWIVDGNLLDPKIVGHPSIAIYGTDSNYDGVVENASAVAIAYVAKEGDNPCVKAALLDLSNGKIYVHAIKDTDTFSEIKDVSIDFGVMDVGNDGTVNVVAAVAFIGYRNSTWTLKLSVVDLSSAISSWGATPAGLGTAWTTGANWDGVAGTEGVPDDVDSGMITGASVFVSKGSSSAVYGGSNKEAMFFDCNGNGVLDADEAYAYIAYFKQGEGLKVAMSQDGDNWSSNIGNIVTVDTEANLNSYTDISVKYSTSGATFASCAIAIAYTDDTDDTLKYAMFATAVSAATPYPLDETNSTLSTNDFSEVTLAADVDVAKGISMATIDGDLLSATVVISYVAKGGEVDAVWLSYKNFMDKNIWTNFANWNTATIDADGWGYTGIYRNGSNSYGIAWVNSEDELWAATGGIVNNTGFATTRYFLADATEFGYGYSVAEGGLKGTTTQQYEASFFDSIVRTLAHVSFTVDFDETTGEATVSYSSFDINRLWDLYPAADKGIVVYSPSTAVNACGTGAYEAIYFGSGLIDVGYRTVCRVNRDGKTIIAYTQDLTRNTAGEVSGDPASISLVVNYLDSSNKWRNYPVMYPGTTQVASVADLDMEMDSSYEDLYVAWADNSGSTPYGPAVHTRRATYSASAGFYADIMTNDIKQVQDLTANDSAKIDLVVVGDTPYIAVGYTGPNTSERHVAYYEVDGSGNWTKVSRLDNLGTSGPVPEVALGKGSTYVVFVNPADRALKLWDLTNVVTISDTVAYYEPKLIMVNGQPFVLVKDVNGEYYLGKAAEGTTLDDLEVSTIASWYDRYTNGDNILASGSWALVFYRLTDQSKVALKTHEFEQKTYTISVSVDPSSLGTVTVGESTSATVTVTLTLNEAYGQDITLDWSASGTEWTATPATGTVTITAGDATATFDVAVTCTPTSAGTKTLTITFTGAPADVTVGSGSVTATAEEAPSGGGGGCSAAGAGSAGLALLLLGPAALYFFRRR